MEYCPPLFLFHVVKTTLFVFASGFVSQGWPFRTSDSSECDDLFRRRQMLMITPSQSEPEVQMQNFCWNCWKSDVCFIFVIELQLWRCKEKTELRDVLRKSLHGVSWMISSDAWNFRVFIYNETIYTVFLICGIDIYMHINPFYIQYKDIVYMQIDAIDAMWIVGLTQFSWNLQ